MELTQCPYDGHAIEVESCSGGSLLVQCPVCDAAWEMHGAWIRRVRAPERDRVAAARTGARPIRR